MENLFKTKEWNRDNLRLICGDLYACMNGQQWVLLWDEVDGDNEITDWNSLRFRSWDSTYTMYITDDRRVRVYKDFKFLRYITFDEMVDRTYSKYFNDDSGVVLKHKDIAMTLNAATTVKNLCLDDIFSIPSAEMFRNACVFDEILFVNVSGKKWYPIFTDIACVYDRAGDGIAAVNNIAFPSRVIIPNKKHRTLDIFRIIGDDGELKHVAVYDKEHIKNRAQSVHESHGWKMMHYLFESELNRDFTETTLMADNKPYCTIDNDYWGEPEKEEKVEFETVSIKEYDNGIEVEIKPKEGFTSLWNKIRKDIFGIKTPSERFEENMKGFKWCDEETLKKFDKNLRDAMRLKDDRKKTLNEIRKEHAFEDTVTREAADDEPISLREMVQPVLDELRDAERYAWNKYIDDFEAKWNHDMLKAHLNEKLVNDNVNAPDHYKLRGLDIEAIDVIRGALTEDEFRGFCKGNVLKYTIREGHKNGDEDLKKAKKYLEFLEEDDSDE